MDKILGQCKGVIGIADDITIHGKDDEEHDRRLQIHESNQGMMTRTQQVGSQGLVKFLGCVYNKYRTHPDPYKLVQSRCLHLLPNESSRASLERLHILHYSYHYYLLT